MLTIAPPPRASSSGMARFMARNTPVRPSSIVWLHTRSSRSPRKARRRRPSGSVGWPKALLCRMSRPPKARTVPATIASMPSGAPASAAMASATPPVLSISRATVSALAQSMSATPTRAPRCANPRAVARPIPEPAPDTSTTLPSNRMSRPFGEVWPRRAPRARVSAHRTVSAKRSIRSSVSGRCSLRKSKTSSLTPSFSYVATSSTTCWAVPEKGRRSAPSSVGADTS